MRSIAAVLGCLLAACSPDPGDDVPPLPKATAESGNALMKQAVAAADDARPREPAAANRVTAPEQQR